MDVGFATPIRSFPGDGSSTKLGRGAARKTPFVAAVEGTGEGCPTRIKLTYKEVTIWPG